MDPICTVAKLIEARGRMFFTKCMSVMGCAVTVVTSTYYLNPFKHTHPMSHVVKKLS